MVTIDQQTLVDPGNTTSVSKTLVEKQEILRYTLERNINNEDYTN